MNRFNEDGTTYCRCGEPDDRDCDCTPWDIDQTCGCECGCGIGWTTEDENDFICFFCERGDHYGDHVRYFIDCVDEFDW